MKILLLLFTFIFCSVLHAEVILTKNNKGRYYEVHKNRDGSHTFFFVPHIEEPVMVSGLKSEKAIFGFFGLRGQKGSTLLKKALAEGKMDKTDPLIMFTVDTSVVDELFLKYSRIARDSNGLPTPGGSVYHTDLLWLIKESKREERYVDHTKK